MIKNDNDTIDLSFIGLFKFYVDKKENHWCFDPLFSPTPRSSFANAWIFSEKLKSIHYMGTSYAWYCTKFLFLGCRHRIGQYTVIKLLKFNYVSKWPSSTWSSPRNTGQLAKERAFFLEKLNHIWKLFLSKSFNSMKYYWPFSSALAQDSVVTSFLSTICNLPIWCYLLCHCQKTVSILQFWAILIYWKAMGPKRRHIFEAKPKNRITRAATGFGQQLKF